VAHNSRGKTSLYLDMSYNEISHAANIRHGCAAVAGGLIDGGGGLDGDRLGGRGVV